jgi:hypothetical protein
VSSRFRLASTALKMAARDKPHELMYHKSWLVVYSSGRAMPTSGATVAKHLVRMTSCSRGRL